MAGVSTTKIQFQCLEGGNKSISRSVCWWLVYVEDLRVQAGITSPCSLPGHPNPEEYPICGPARNAALRAYSQIINKFCSDVNFSEFVCEQRTRGRLGELIKVEGENGRAFRD
jgi:hypothetical protein